MPRLDPTTLLTVSFATTFLVGLLLVLSWRQAPDSRALGLWGGAHLIGSLGTLGLALRGMIPDPVSIGLANVAILAAYGLIWSGVRLFEGRPWRPRLALAPAAAWAGLCLVPAFYGSIAARIVFASGAAGILCFAAAVEFWRGRAERLASRGPAIVLLAVYGVCYVVRVPATLLWPPGEGAVALGTPWVAVLCFAAMLFSIASAFTFMALIKERAEREQRLAAGTDPLTGVANRRAFMEDARRRLAGSGSAALLVFDLDWFKTINDTHGHAVGDAVLVGFCAVAEGVLPADASLGRLGGEEFACLLVGARPARARAVAERVRRVYSGLAVPELPGLRLSVSVGLAQSDGTGGIDALLRRADAALYAAKAAGRNRIAVAEPAYTEAA